MTIRVLRLVLIYDNILVKAPLFKYTSKCLSVSHILYLSDWPRRCSPVNSPSNSSRRRPPLPNRPSPRKSNPPSKRSPRPLCTSSTITLDPRTHVVAQQVRPQGTHQQIAKTMWLSRPVLSSFPTISK